MALFYALSHCPFVNSTLILELLHDYHYYVVFENKFMSRSDITFPIILAIETSTDICSVGLCIGDRILVRSGTTAREHTRLLLPMIESLLEEANIKLSELSALCCTVGPGSFTGIRIGTAMTQALAFALDKSVILVSTLRLIAQTAFVTSHHSKILAQLNLSQKERVEGHFVLNEALGLMEAISEERIVDIALDDKIIPDAGFVTVGDLPNVECLLQIARFEYEKGSVVQAGEVEPVYLSNSELFRKTN